MVSTWDKLKIDLGKYVLRIYLGFRISQKFTSLFFSLFPHTFIHTDWHGKFIAFYILKINSKTYVVGSSKNIIGGLSISSKAIDKRFFCPPDKFPHLVIFVNFKFSVSRILSIWKID